MASLGPMRWRSLVLVAPLSIFGCFTAGDDGGGESDDGDVKGCRADSECRLGRVCVDVTGDGDDFCETGEDCECAQPGTGGTSSGGSSSGGGGTSGNETGGTANGGTANGGTANGGTANGGTANGGTSTGGSSGAGSCGPYCTRLVAAMCAATTETACLSDCNDLAAECPSQTTALSACVANAANAVTCQAGQTVVSGCDSQIDSLNRCFVCVAQTTDTTCGTCSKRSCCEEFGSYNLAPDVDAFYACASACTTTQCFDACVLASPVAGTAFSALSECQDDSCAEPCICGASTSDDACDTCYKSSCCTEYATYVLAPNALEFENCAFDCTTDACFEACIDQYPEAGNNYVGWVACIDGNCSTECAP